MFAGAEEVVVEDVVSSVLDELLVILLLDTLSEVVEEDVVVEDVVVEDVVVEDVVGDESGEEEVDVWLVAVVRLELFREVVWHLVVVDVVGVACFSVLLQTAPSTCEFLTGALSVCLK